MDAAHHRKIDLQSASDLTYLLSNIKAAAAQKLDLAIPPSAAPAGEEDAYRTKVEELVLEYIHQTLHLALPSLTLNGIDPPPSASLLPSPKAPLTTALNNNNNNNNNNPPSAPSDPETYEPYDPRLAAKLRALYAQFDAESTRVAELRREAPGAAARVYVERLEREMRDEREGEGGGGVEGKEGEEVLEIGGLERRGEMERMWGRGVEGLGRLGGVGGVVGKLERAEKGADFVLGG